MMNPHDLLRRTAARLDRRGLMRAMRDAGLVLAAVPVLPRMAAANEELTYFTWSGYDLPQMHAAYIDTYGGSPAYAYFSDEEEALQRVRSGFTPDIAHPCINTAGRWRDAGVIKAIDTSRLSNWPDLFPEFTSIPGVAADGEVWMAPVDWGTSSIMYRRDLVEIDEESWSLLLDERYAGRISFLDATDNVAAVGGILSGAETWYDMNDEEFARAEEVWRRLNANVRFYWNDPTEMEQAMASGEIVAAWAWASSYASLAREGIDVAYMNPKEGIMTWVCGMVMVADGPGDEQRAYDFIDAMLSPETGKFLIEDYGYGHTNAKAFELADPAALERIGLGDPAAFLADGNFFVEVAPDKRQRIAETWEEIRAGM